MPTKAIATKTKKSAGPQRPVFADRARGGALFVVHVEAAPGAPHVLVARAHYGAGGDSPVELFRVNQGNGYIVPKPPAVSTGLIDAMRERGLVDSGRLVSEWRAFLVGA